MGDLISSMLLWIAATTNYHVDPDPEIHIEYRSYTELAVMYHQPNTLADLAGKTPVAALHIRGVIFLPDDFSPTDLEDQSTLLQELYHYVQFHNGQMKLRCAGKIEREAYQAENEWRAEHGLELIPKADILWIEMSRCPPERHLHRTKRARELKERRVVSK